ncbi:MAG: LysE family transporter [Alphaproteobacteria bacterium]|nr:LysE family transporter [Alphaproteobacteria bacterium]
MLLTLIPAYGLFLLAVMSPGPDFIMTVQMSVRHGARAGMATALGIALANLIHIAYVHIGIGALIAHSLLAFSILKLLAAAYLIYLGYKALRSRTGTTDINLDAQQAQTASLRKAFGQGFITNALNPKAAIFWLSYLTIVVDPAMPPALLWSFIALLLLTAFIWFSLVAYFLTRQAIRQQFMRCGHWFDRAMGLLLVGLGIKVALASR